MMKNEPHWAEFIAFQEASDLLMDIIPFACLFTITITMTDQYSMSFLDKHQIQKVAGKSRNNHQESGWGPGSLGLRG